MSAPNSGQPLIHTVIEFQSMGLDARLLLNDVELARTTPADRKILQQKVNGWLTFGGNELVIEAALPDPHKAARPNLKCLIFRGPFGRQPDESEALARYEEDKPASFPGGNRQVVWATKFSSEPNYGPWRWEMGRPFALENQAMQAGLYAVSSVVAWLNEKRNADLLHAFRVVTEESVRAYGMSPQLIAEQLLEWAGSWTPQPTEIDHPEDFAFGWSDPSGDHRVVFVLHD